MIGKRPVIASALLLGAVVLSGCQSPVRSSADESGAMRQGTTSATAGQRCRIDTPNAASGGPDAIYAEMNACINAQQFDRAVFLYGLAGSYTWFDANRLDTQYARMAHGKRLGEALAQLSEKQVTQFWDHLRATMQDPNKKQGVCNKVRQAGMPTHSLDYMRLDKTTAGASVPAAQQDWNRAVDNYLSCK